MVPHSIRADGLGRRPAGVGEAAARPDERRGRAGAGRRHATLGKRPAGAHQPRRAAGAGLLRILAAGLPRGGPVGRPGEPGPGGGASPKPRPVSVRLARGGGACSGSGALDRAGRRPGGPSHEVRVGDRSAGPRSTTAPRRHPLCAPRSRLARGACWDRCRGRHRGPARCSAGDLASFPGTGGPVRGATSTHGRPRQSLRRGGDLGRGGLLRNGKAVREARRRGVFGRRPDRRRLRLGAALRRHDGRASLPISPSASATASCA